MNKPVYLSVHLITGETLTGDIVNGTTERSLADLVTKFLTNNESNLEWPIGGVQSFIPRSSVLYIQIEKDLGF